MSLSSLTRRSFTFSSAAVIGFLHKEPSYAGIDPSALQSLPLEGGGTPQQRLQQLEATTKLQDTTEVPWTKLDDGTSYREYREGRGEATVQQGSKVAVEMTIRCKSFSTANEPGGLKYYSTKQDTDFNELAFAIGSGEVFPELEEGMIGMKKGGLRRIDIPSTAAFAARNRNQLPLPTTKDGKRLFERLFKTDASLIVEVLVTRVK